MTEPSDQLVRVLAAAGSYVRSVVCHAHSFEGTRELAETLALVPRPFLTRLVLTRNGDSQRAGLVLDDELVARLIAATPNLVDLDADLRALCRVFPHPRVERLRASVRAIETLAGGNATPMPAVTELDLALSERHDWGDPFDPQAAARFLPPAAFPALVRLDLSRNEQGLFTPFHRGHDNDVYAILRGLPIRAQLVHVRMPSIRRPSDVEHCAEMPRLATIEIARGYPDGAACEAQVAALPHIRMPSWTFPWPREVNHNDKLMFVIATIAHAASTGELVDRYSHEHGISVQALVEALEREVETFDTTTRALWTRLWATWLAMQHDETRDFTRADFDAMVDSLPRVDDPAWARLRENLAYLRSWTPDPAKTTTRTFTITRWVH